MKHERRTVEQGVPSADTADRAASRSAPARPTAAGRPKGVKPVERGRRMTGSIARLWYGQGHGFIRADDRREMFFHYRDVVAGLFNDLAVRDRVLFEVVEDAIAGPRAVRVRRAAQAHIRGRRR